MHVKNVTGIVMRYFYVLRQQVLNGGKGCRNHGLDSNRARYNVNLRYTTTVSLYI